MAVQKKISPLKAKQVADMACALMCAQIQNGRYLDLSVLIDRYIDLATDIIDRIKDRVDG